MTSPAPTTARSPRSISRQRPAPAAALAAAQPRAVQAAPRRSALDVAAWPVVARAMLLLCSVGIIVYALFIARGVWNGRERLYGLQGAALVETTRLVGASVASGVRWKRVEAVEAALARFVAHDGMQASAVMVQDRDGATLASWTSTQRRSLDLGPYLPQAAAMADLAEQTASWTEHHLVVTVPVYEKAGEPLGAVTVAWSLEPLQAAIVDDIRQQLLGTVVLGGLLLVSLVVILTRLVGRPLRQLGEAMEALAAGDLSVEIPARGRRDDVGRMAAALVVFQHAAQAKLALQQTQAEERAAAEQARQAMLAEMADSIGGVVAAAGRGDFSGRVARRFDSAELTQIGADLDRLMASIQTGMTAASQALSGFAEGDFTRRMEGRFSGAFARLQSDIDAMAGQMATVLRQIGTASAEVMGAASQLQAAADDLSHRTTQQAATIQQTTATSEVLARTLTDNAAHAATARTQVGRAATEAEAGGQVMGEAAAAMARMSEASAKISNIIRLIEDIAFQTNLLALNASVEAARAGDAGKGFAVVASEVRRLAQSAAQASTDIRDLITASVAEIDAGTGLVRHAVSALGTVGTAIRDAASVMDRIARAAAEQSTSVAELDSAIRQMDQITQQNAALAEETNAAIVATRGQAETLDRLIAHFRIAS